MIDLDVISVLGGGTATGGVAVLYIRHLFASQRNENKELKSEVADLRKEIHEQVNKRLEAAAAEKDLEKLESEVRFLRARLERLADDVNMPLLNEQMLTMTNTLKVALSKMDEFMITVTRHEAKLENQEAFLKNLHGRYRHLEKAGDTHG